MLIAEVWGVPPLQNVHGYVARDDEKKELIVAMRGSGSVVDILLDTAVALVPFISPGVTHLPSGVCVHSGFLIAWNAVALQILAILKEQFYIYEIKGYSLVAAGHSLGGSLASLATVALKENFPEHTMRCYTYGAPRTGNKEFADYFNATFGENACRVVHSSDGVCTIIPRSFGYHHHGVEYWQQDEENTVKCSGEGEDPRCSCKNTGGVNTAHMEYFGIIATTPFCL
ncbi:alpha/beta-hydrolase [Cylindrobasidium torrendii FP15055 ss-10]|uniref:Alpha/beta-hydrolase n=1 Tax=Cylindrobasidium torrendii FP15055 ss-10 TaxID=1314674 RepID=A0A0D7B7A5_9AGAR|nr:alpha/beta-hydrolase [Cylindrobasidium torrendii FP15055 ss-10]